MVAFASLCSVADLSDEALAQLLHQADAYQTHSNPGEKQVSQEMAQARESQKTVALIFFEPSTRTRISFEQAARQLGAKTILVDTNTSSYNKGESLLDAARTLESLGVDALVVRHPMAGAAQFLAQHTSLPCINAGDGCHEHPTQA